MVRRAALDVLGHLAEHHGQALPEAVGRRAVELTQDEDAEVRAEACASLALLPATPAELPERARALSARLDDAHPEVRQEAAAALGDLPSLGAEPSEAARDRLASALEDADARVRFEAAFALASLRDPRARAPLERALGDRRRRLDALEALARLGDADALPAVRALDGRWLLPWADRLSALACRVRLGDLDARAALAARVRSRRFEERVHACALAGQLGATEALEELRALAARPGEPAREAAIEALGALGAPEDASALARWRDDGSLDADTRAVADEAHRALTARLEDD